MTNHMFIKLFFCLFCLYFEYISIYNYLLKLMVALKLKKKKCKSLTRTGSNYESCCERLHIRRHQGHPFWFSNQFLCEMTLTAGRMFDRGTGFGHLFLHRCGGDKMSGKEIKCPKKLPSPLSGDNSPIDGQPGVRKYSSSFPNGRTEHNRARSPSLRDAKTSCEHEV